MSLELRHPLKVTPARDSAARQAFVSALRGYILNDLAGALRSSYETAVAPEFVRQHGRSPQNEDEVHGAMLSDTCFKFYSAIRYNAQEMVWRSVIPDAEGALAEISRKIDACAGNGGGSLALDPALELPRNMARIDVHLMPGGYAPDDTPLAGAIYDQGLAVFAAGMMGHNLDDIGLSMANYVKYRFPGFRPERILDCGATVGHNAVPWAQTFPQAQVHAIDVSDAVLRYGHGRAESLGVPVHFHQMDATRLRFAPDSFDVVFSSMFLHELPLRDIRRFFAEAHRVLRPGGLLLNMELPPNHELTPYDQFYLDWDCYYNLEPYYRGFRDQNPQDLVVAGGFRAEDYLQFVVPQFSYTPEGEFAAAVGGTRRVNRNTGRLSSGVQWFGFGAWKRT